MTVRSSAAEDRRSPSNGLDPGYVAPDASGASRQAALAERIYAPTLAAACFLVYLLAPLSQPHGDTIPALSLPISILVDHNLTLDWLQQYLGTPLDIMRRRQVDAWDSYFVYIREGHLYSAYPVATPLLLVPLSIPVLAALSALGAPLKIYTAVAVGRVIAAAVAALGVAAMYQLLVRLSRPRVAAVLALAFAFGTSHWSTSSQQLWQHGPGVLFLLLTLLAIQRQAPARIAGTLAGVAVAIRPLNLFFWIACVVGLWLARRSRRELFGFVMPGVVIGAALATYNLWLFGRLGGFYGGMPFNNDPLEGFAGLLINPSRGLFIFSPFLLVGVIGAWRFARPERPVLLIAALFALLHLLGLSNWWAWHGSCCYGPRLMTETAAMLVVLAVPAAEQFSRRSWVAFGLAAAVAAGAHGIGVYRHQLCAWERPESGGAPPRALWSITESQILYFLR